MQPPTPPKVSTIIRRCCSACGCTGTCRLAIEDGGRMRLCACRRVLYCSETCRKEHYPLHKQQCRQIQPTVMEKLVRMRNNVESRGMTLLRLILSYACYQAGSRALVTGPPVVIISKTVPGEGVLLIEDGLYCTFRHLEESTPCSLLDIEYTCDGESMRVYYFVEINVEFCEKMIHTLVRTQVHTRSVVAQRYLAKKKLSLLEYLIIDKILVHEVGVSKLGKMSSSALVIEEFSGEEEVTMPPINHLFVNMTSVHQPD